MWIYVDNINGYCYRLPISFLHVKLYFGALHIDSSDVTSSDTKSGLKPLQL